MVYPKSYRDLLLASYRGRSFWQRVFPGSTREEEAGASVTSDDAIRRKDRIKFSVRRDRAGVMKMLPAST